MDTDASEAGRLLARRRWGDAEDKREARRAALLDQLADLDRTSAPASDRGDDD